MSREQERKCGRSKMKTAPPALVREGPFEIRSARLRRAASQARKPPANKKAEGVGKEEAAGTKHGTHANSFVEFVKT